MSAYSEDRFMTLDEIMVKCIDHVLQEAERIGVSLDALMMSQDSFAKLKALVPRKQYRKRQGTRFINAYRGVPIEIHDEWAWGWQTRPRICHYLALPTKSRWSIGVT